MNVDFFDVDEILNRRGPAVSETEAFWDAKAEPFLACKRTYGTSLTDRVVRRLTDEGMLGPEDSVLDVGCAYGRYALPFAAAAKHVTAADVSSRMLELCAERARDQGLANLETLKHDWGRDGLDGLEGRFDLVFACMCTPARTPEGLAKMTAASRRHCVVAQYVSMEDTLMKALAGELGMDRSDDHHNGRDIAWAIFNRLWLDGFLPQMTFLERNEDRALGLDEALDRYGMGLGKAASEQGKDLRALLSARAVDGGVPVKGRTILALVSWNAREHGLPSNETFKQR